MPAQKRAQIAALSFTREPSLKEVTESGLLADIRQRGIISPPVVRQTPDGPKWGEIVVGNGRVTAWAALGNTEVDVTDLGPISAAEALKTIVLDHTLRREMGSSEMFGYVVAFLRATGCAPPEALAALGITGPNRTKILTVLGGAPACVEDVIAGRVPPTTAYEAMSKVRQPQAQVEFFGRIKAEKLSRDEVIGILRPKSGRRPKPAQVGTGFDRNRTGLEKLAAWFKTGMDAVAYALKLDAPDSAKVDVVLDRVAKGAKAN